MAGTRDRELSERWNTLGRQYQQACSERIAEFYAGKRALVPAGTDPRDKDLATEVLDRVRELNSRGDWRQARRLFDPAWEPFHHLLEEKGGDPHFATALGADSFVLPLVTLQDEPALFRFDGEDITCTAGGLACAFSNDRRHFAVAHEERGIIVSEGLEGPLVAEVPWPDPQARVPSGLPAELGRDWARSEGAPEISGLRVADDGKRIVIVTEDEGVLLADARRSPATWRLLLPDYGVTTRLEELLSYIKGDDPPYSDSLDMAHADISPDGAFVALGQQDTEHLVLALDAEDRRPYAKIGQQSEYPHFARFSGDGRSVVFNSCHFYDGVTGILDLASARGLETESYEEDPRFPIIDSNLRVYAATWLPPDAVARESGAFALAGMGWMRCVTPTGEILWEHFFGSSASSLDYCPSSNTLLLSSYSGFLHLLDAGTEAEPGREIGYRPRKERKRWIFWDGEDTLLQW